MKQTMSLSNSAMHTTFLFLLINLSSCANISLNKIVSIETVGRTNYVSKNSGAGYVKIYRAGQRLDARRGIELKPGDEIETSPYGSVAIKFREHGTVILDANTRVRIGSLELIFGKIFADVRGLFSTYNDDLVLAVEGTQFMFEASANGVSRTVVREGIVRISSKRNIWAPVRVRSDNEFRSSPRNQGGKPIIVPANPRDLREISIKFNQVTNAPEQGFCCSNGKVNQSLSNGCRGKFYRNINSAKQGCQQGWCCKKSKVNFGMKHQCYGKLYTNQKSAISACAPPPEPKGWCCSHGRLNNTTQKKCQGRGTFYKQISRARAACKVQVY